VRALAHLVRVAEAITRGVGGAASWLVLVTVLVCAAVAVLRYGFGYGRIWLQELYVSAFGVCFMLVAARAYADDAHIRIDILSRRWSPRTRALVELAGGALLLAPWLAVVAWASRPFLRLSWMVREPSPQAGGLPALYLLKAVIPLFAALLLLQGLAAMARSLLVLCRREDLLPPPPADRVKDRVKALAQ
jgi:TRAP-type mannitol/chloroaromatic compound transport system permease small subunit